MKGIHQNVSLAKLWNSDAAFEMAKQIAALRGLYCGPATAVWIAAVWHAAHGVQYDYRERLKDKLLFPDGPRSFTRSVPGFQLNLNQTLRRETKDQLGLSTKRHYKIRNIHELIMLHEMPFIVRIPLASFRDGLHYATLFKSVVSEQGFDLHCQDNGVLSSKKIQEGISIMARGTGASFLWGARQVIRLIP